jgi:hypothetical protein
MRSRRDGFYAVNQRLSACSSLSVNCRRGVYERAFRPPRYSEPGLDTHVTKTKRKGLLRLSWPCNRPLMCLTRTVRQITALKRAFPEPFGGLYGPRRRQEVGPARGPAPVTPRRLPVVPRLCTRSRPHRPTLSKHANRCAHPGPAFRHPLWIAAPAGPAREATKGTAATVAYDSGSARTAAGASAAANRPGAVRLLDLTLGQGQLAVTVPPRRRSPVGVGNVYARRKYALILVSHKRRTHNGK